ncbi:hypothetical protein ACHMW6_24090 [Pseudoduganella sp. UC29_106]|uniref:hypothetical protein n=1 Tax=Pseudoduganella sp. UC29_106 TaxID=3374553 RepID=UPI003756F0F4
MDRLFTVIGRINSVLLLVVLLGAGISVGWMMVASNRWERRGAVEVPEAASSSKQSVMLTFSQLESITGANAQMLRLTTHEKSQGFSSGSSGSEIRNVLFLTGTAKTARWLFKDHKNIILNVSQLHREPTDRNERVEQPTKALYFEYVTDDTNGDGKLSSEDHSNVALTTQDGTGFTEVLHNADRIFSFEVLDQMHLSVVYQKGATVRHAKYLLTSLKLEVDQEIITVPKKI